jgi:DNA-binding SARP family transcriptional activator/Tfp pilus assembly protein PilF
MSRRSEPDVRFEVLGPLRAWRGDLALPLGPVQQRVVMAVLVLHANRPIGRERLIDAVWGPAAPTYAVNLLQKHVSGLRRALEPARPGRSPSRLLAWTGAGYLLTPPDGGLDLEVFDREVVRARAARAAGDLPGAAAGLRAALGLWRGPVCDGLTSPFLDAERDRLTERRITVLEDRIEVDLALGDNPDLVAEVRQLVAEHPLRERLRALVMVALYRAGRRAEALAAFHDARRQLRDELGLEPGAALQRLHQRMLAADPALDGPADTHDLPATAAGLAGGGDCPSAGSLAGAGRKAAPTPAQLPHSTPDFTGRDVELARLHAPLVAQDGAVVIVAISGTAGVGKTALAVQWAHQVRDRCPDGQLYVNLRGFDPSGSAVEPGEAIRGFLDALGVPPTQVPAGLPAQAARYRSLLAGRRVLVVLDNARDSDQVRPLLPGTPGCLVVVTSRNRLTSLVATDSAHPLVVDLLSPREARELLVRRLGATRAAAEPAAVDAIVDASARLPLAVAIVAARAATSPGFPLSVLADQLRDARGSLDVFDGEDAATDLRAVFSWSYRQLSDPAAGLFRLLGLHAGPDIGVPAAASLAGLPAGPVRRLLAELARAHLVTEPVPGRFLLHDLLRAYATELAHAEDPETDRRAAVRRVLDHYLHTAFRADQLLNPHRDDPVTLAPPRPGVRTDELADHVAALAWFSAEQATLLAIIRQTTGFDTEIWQLTWTLTPFFEHQGYWDDWAEILGQALDTGRRLTDLPRQVLAHRLIGCVYIRRGRYYDAHAHLRQALDLAEALGDRTGQAHAHRELSWVLERQGRHSEALPHAVRALDLHRAAGNRPGEGRGLNAVGWFHAQLGDHEQALVYCQQALDLQQQLGDRYGEAETWDSLGYIHHHLGHHRTATTCYQRAADLYREFGDRYNEADTLASLGDAHHAAGDVAAAGKTWQEALAILDQLGHCDADQVRVRLDKLGEAVASRTG